MKKFFVLPVIGLILGAVAIATEIRTTDLVPTGQQLSGAVVSCVKIAVQKRESTVLSALVSYQSGSLLALTTRTTSLLTAWDKSTKNEAKSTITATWKTYKTTMDVLKNTLSSARKSAWDLYKTEVKACKGNASVQGIDITTVKNEI